MKIWNYRITLPTIHDSFTLIPFCCVHWDHPGCHTELFRRFLQRATNPTVYTLGLGDMLDFARSHYRTELRKVLPDEDSPEALDCLVANRLDVFLQEIKPALQMRCLGLIEGNHRWQFMTSNPPRFFCGETSTAYIARALQVPYLEYTAMIDVQITVKDLGITDTYTILANHGEGSGASSAGSDLNKLEGKVAQAFMADLYVTGHTHRRLAYFSPQMELDRDQHAIRERSALLVKAGAFLRGYLPDKETYASRKLLKPLDLGWVEIKIGYVVRNSRVYRRVSLGMEQDVDMGPMEMAHATNDLTSRRGRSNERNRRDTTRPTKKRQKDKPKKK
jgi:hypothetical protein